MRRIKWKGHETRGGEERCLLDFGGKPEGKRSLGRPWRSWKYNIKIDFHVREYGGKDWIYLAQDMDR